MKHSVIPNSYEKRKAKYLALVLSLFAIVLVSACNQSKPTTSSTPKSDRVTFDLSETRPGSINTQSITRGNDITVTFEKTADWDAGSGKRGFTANITLLNETGKSLDDWDLRFSFPPTIDQMWNARLSTANAAAGLLNPEADSSVKVIPAIWNGTLDDGQSRSFGFKGSYSGVFQEPSAYVLSGIPVGDQAVPEPVAQACSLDTRFQVNSSWQNGDGSQGFVAELYLTNTGSQPVNWNLEFNFAASINNMWNAGFVQDDEGYQVSPADWNARVEPGQTRNFGFQGSHIGTLGEPQNVACNSDEEAEPEDETDPNEPPVANSGTLAPGGTFESATGVTIDANDTTFDEEIEVSIEASDQWPSDEPYIEPDFSLGSPFYTIASSVKVDTYPDTFKIRLPLPEGGDPDTLSVAFFATEARNVTGHEEGSRWFPKPYKYDPETKEFVFARSVLYPDGEIFVLRSHSILESTSSGSKFETLNIGETPNEDAITIVAKCDELFAKSRYTCSNSDIAATEAAVRKALSDFKELGFKRPNLETLDGVATITIRPEDFEKDGLNGAYRGREMIVVIGASGITEAKELTVRHELFHAVQYAYDSMRIPAGGDRRYLTEGMAALSMESGVDGVEIITSRYGPRPVTPGLLEADGGLEYQMQDFWYSIAEQAKKDGVPLDFGIFRAFLEPTGLPDIDRLSAFDINRVDYVLRNWATLPGGKDKVKSIPGGVSEAYANYIEEKIDAIDPVDFNDEALFFLNVGSVAGGGGVIGDNTLGVTFGEARTSPLSTSILKYSLDDGTYLENIEPSFDAEENGYKFTPREVAGTLYVFVTNTSLSTPAPESEPGDMKVAFDLTSSDDGRWSQTFGDPHLSTPDGRLYDFHGAGDYILTRSTVSGDTFEVQARYLPFEERGFQWSGESALAMRVGSDVVELYANAGAALDIFVNGTQTYLGNEEIFFLPSGGTIKSSVDYNRREGSFFVYWPDGTILRASAFAPDASKNISGFSRIFFPASKSGKIEGLMGNFNGIVGDDLRLRNGSVFKETELAIYTEFRKAWSLTEGAGTRLFSQGSDPYRPNFPTVVANLNDFPKAVVEASFAKCRNAGVLDAFTLTSCAFDVIVTGNDIWAEIAVAVDPVVNALDFSISPGASVMAKGESRTFEITSYAYGPGDLTWSATEGRIGGSGREVTYTAPIEPGTYTLTAQAVDTDFSASVTILVKDAATLLDTNIKGTIEARSRTSFSFEAEAGQTLNASVRKLAFNTVYIEVYDSSGVLVASARPPEIFISSLSSSPTRPKFDVDTTGYFVIPETGTYTAVIVNNERFALDYIAAIAVIDDNVELGSLPTQVSKTFDVLGDGVIYTFTPPEDAVNISLSGACSLGAYLYGEAGYSVDGIDLSLTPYSGILTGQQYLHVTTYDFDPDKSVTATVTIQSAAQVGSGNDQDRQRTCSEEGEQETREDGQNAVD